MSRISIYCFFRCFILKKYNFKRRKSSSELFYSGMDPKYRKTQPIYNAIECRQWNRALNLCKDKKIEKWDIVKVLKGKY